jgi:hypothetical protein
VLANQRGPQQCQCPLGWAQLATADKDADHIVLVSQSELLLHDGIWSAHGNSDLMAAMPRHLGTPPPEFAAPQKATEHGGPPSLTQASLTWLVFRGHSSGIYVVLSKYWNRHPTDHRMAILATINIVIICINVNMFCSKLYIYDLSYIMYNDLWT